MSNFYGGQFFGGGFFGVGTPGGVGGPKAKAKKKVIRLYDADRETTADFLKAQLKLRQGFPEPLKEIQEKRGDAHPLTLGFDQPRRHHAGPGPRGRPPARDDDGRARPRRRPTRAVTAASYGFTLEIADALGCDATNVKVTDDLEVIIIEFTYDQITDLLDRLETPG